MEGVNDQKLNRVLTMFTIYYTLYRTQSSMFFMYSFESLVSIISCCSLMREYPDSSKASIVCCSTKHRESGQSHELHIERQKKNSIQNFSSMQKLHA